MDGTIASTVPVVVEENVHLQLCSSRCERPLIGVLVGRITSNSSYVLHFVPTPGAPDSPDPCRFPFEDWWVEDHAHQVWDLLPGGISVVGLCLISPSFNDREAASLVRLTQQLYQPTDPLHNSQPHTLLVLHFSTVTASLTCQCVQLPRTCVQSVDVVIRSCLKDNWCHLEATVPIQMKTIVSSSQDLFLELHQKLANGLQQWRLGVVLFGSDSNYCSSDETVANYVNNGCVQCTVYPRPKELHCGQSRRVGNATAVTLHGMISALAYLPIEATVMEASKDVTGDVVDTIVIRWRRMYEDLQQQNKQLLSTQCQPKRVQLTVEGWMFRLCAYQFPDETAMDMCERVSEVVGVEKKGIHILTREKELILKQSNSEPNRISWIVTTLITVTAIVATLFCFYYKC